MAARNVPTKESYIEFETFVVNKLNNRLALDHKIKSFDNDTCHILLTRKEKSKIPIIIIFVRRLVQELIYKQRLKSEKSRKNSASQNP